MQKIAIICALERELRFYLESMENITSSESAGLTFHRGKLNGKDVVAVACGVCKVNAAIATQLLISEYKATTAICSGVAGGIDKALRIGDTVMSTKVAYHDIWERSLIDLHPFMKDENFYCDKNLVNSFKKIAETENFSQKIHFGKIVTGDLFIDQDGRDGIIEKHNPLCVDMETGAIAHTCYVNNVPFIAARSISDTEDESGLDVFEANCDFAAKMSFDVVNEYLKQC